MLASDRIQRLERVLVGVYDLPARDFMWTWLVHPHQSIVIRNIPNDLPVNLPILVGEGPPLRLLVSHPKLHCARTNEQRDHRLESLVEVERRAVFLELVPDVVGNLVRDKMRVVAQLLLPPQHTLDHKLNVVGTLANQLALVHVPDQVQLRVSRVLEHGPVASGHRHSPVHGDAVEGRDPVLGLHLGREDPNLMLRRRHRRVCV
mmetsp:Transcript_30449/g.68788  ORF Transcript_30449/g.68788 Transcript_30449/m.68788 type:complete len:204 (+) Transcript_30449:824-1435(+)